MKNIIHLDKIEKDDKCLVGNKAYKLAELEKEGFNVKKGLSITTNVFKSFIKNNSLEKEIEKVSEMGNKEAASEKVLKIRKRIDKIEIDEKFLVELEKETVKLGFGRTAVRSSATCEDNLKASFAGQFDTYLNVERKNLSKRVKEVWASVFSKNIVYYTDTIDIKLSDIKMSVLVMDMVDASKAGVIFTKDVISGDDNLITIEGAPGLGDKVVDGSTIPDNVIVNKKSKKIEKKTRVDILSEEEIYLLAEEAIKIENKYDQPQDIEWAIEKGKVWILQTRPITT